jgi:DNA-directed RNA polymerase specialized sigma24 family protein
MRHVWRAVKVHQGEPRAAPAASQPLGATIEPLARLVDEAVYRALWRLVAGLPARLRDVVIRRYGLADAPPACYREIGAALGVSGEWARRLHQEALVRLRQPAACQTLRSLLARHTRADYDSADALAQHWLRQRGGRRER